MVTMCAKSLCLFMFMVGSAISCSILLAQGLSLLGTITITSLSYVTTARKEKSTLCGGEVLGGGGGGGGTRVRNGFVPLLL